MKSVSKYIILIIILVVPALVYNYMTKGYNNFIKLDVIGEDGHVIPKFSFVNQNNEVITDNDLNGNIYVANFFFTSCPTICPVMTKNMAYIQSKLDVYPNIRFLSHTVDPLNDTPNKMAKYISDLQSKNISIDLDNWDFVTGDKNEIYEIAKTYFVNASKDP